MKFVGKVLLCVLTLIAAALLGTAISAVIYPIG